MRTKTEVQARLRNRVLQELAAAYPLGLTDSELCQRLHANKNHLPCRRLEVERQGLCQKTTTRRKTDTGTVAIVHVVTEKGRQFAQSGQSVPAYKRPPSESQRTTLSVRRGGETIQTIAVTAERAAGNQRRFTLDSPLSALAGDELITA